MHREDDCVGKHAIAGEVCMFHAEIFSALVT